MADLRTTKLKTADRDFRIRLKVKVPPGGLGARLNELHAWLDHRLGREGYFLTSAKWSSRNDAMAIHFDDPAAFPDIMDWLTEAGLESPPAARS